MQESFAEIPFTRAKQLYKMFKFLGTRPSYKCQMVYECDYMVKRWKLSVKDGESFKLLAELAVFEPKDAWSFKERHLAL